jgi:hypothetical protein
MGTHNDNDIDINAKISDIDNLEKRIEELEKKSINIDMNLTGTGLGKQFVVVYNAPLYKIA